MGGGYVYLVFDSGRSAYKIGASGNLPTRIKQIASQAKGSLRIVGVIASDRNFWVERAFKVAWADRRIEGEWFALGPEEVRAFLTHPSDPKWPDPFEEPPPSKFGAKRQYAPLRVGEEVHKV
jgi:hypothetical protein